MEHSLYYLLEQFCLHFLHCWMNELTPLKNKFKKRQEKYNQFIFIYIAPNHNISHLKVLPILRNDSKTQ